VSLEDISDALPAYREDVVSVELAGKLQDAYQRLQDDITATLQEHRGNRSVLSTMVNALLAYPDHPYGLGTLYGSRRTFGSLRVQLCTLSSSARSARIERACWRRCSAHECTRKVSR
jgi:hypothetical protein